MAVCREGSMLQFLAVSVQTSKMKGKMRAILPPAAVWDRGRVLTGKWINDAIQGSWPVDRGSKTCQRHEEQNEYRIQGEHLTV